MAFIHHYTMNKPFGIRFNIGVNHCELYANLNTVLAHAIDNLPEYKLLDRCEPTISSLDEHKQLRMSLACEFKNSSTLVFKVYPTEHSTRAMLGRNKPDRAGTFSILPTLDFLWPVRAIKTKIFGR